MQLVKLGLRHVWRKASEIVSGITKSQRALSAWDRRTVVNQFEVSPGLRDTHYVVVQLQDDPDIVESSADMTGKHSKNSTLIQMDKNGDYRLVHGPKLRTIKQIILKYCLLDMAAKG
ncbi:hypothetical protein BSPWISOXPB_219 [uncultured Gammaproteobacteria bacterium]|nr:hypothetical protein BSPWISOXPB_219 [uncultured Gammaproteobacteria bacterium]